MLRSSTASPTSRSGGAVTQERRTSRCSSCWPSQRYKGENLGWHPSRRSKSLFESCSSTSVHHGRASIRSTRSGICAPTGFGRSRSSRNSKTISRTGQGRTIRRSQFFSEQEHMAVYPKTSSRHFDLDQTLSIRSLNNSSNPIGSPPTTKIFSTRSGCLG